jgi:hypothetical protein
MLIYLSLGLSPFGLLFALVAAAGHSRAGR